MEMDEKQSQKRLLFWDFLPLERRSCAGAGASQTLDLNAAFPSQIKVGRQGDEQISCIFPFNIGREWQGGRLSELWRLTGK